jgi:pilus assembly protein Flp/PilA
MHRCRLVLNRCARALALLPRDRRAATAIEYGLIAALIVIAMIASFRLVADVTIGMWGNVQTKIGNATGY